MVLRKKSITSVKNAQARKGKEAFDVDIGSDSDFDGDSGEEMVVQKTPQVRNSQSMSAKKVKTPGKTPQKNNSFIGKKQPTSVAKGMKGKKGVQKKKSLGEEMDDDEEDDSDFELDMDDVDMSDDDEDCENIDDVDDEDEEGEEQAQIQKQKSNSKQQRNDVKTKKKIKDADKSEEPQMPISKRGRGTKKMISDGEWDLTLFVGNLPIDVNRDELKALSSDILHVVIPRRFRRFALVTFASEEKVDANYKTLQGKELRGHLLDIDYAGSQSKRSNPKIREERNLKSLYVGNFPIGVTLDELKALSSDIEDVYMDPKSETNHNPYAFIRFASEEKADANYKALQGVKLKGQVLKINYVGQKSSKMASSNALQLCILRIPLSATLGDVATHFPKATKVEFNKSTGFRTAFVTFLKQEDAAEAFNLKEIEIDGHTLNIYEHDSNLSINIWKERNLKSLYVGNFPIGVTLDELKALSSDIEHVYMHPKSETNHNPYAFISFASEEKTDANYKALQGVKLKGQVLKIDYMGQKSSKMASSNALQLCIRRIPLSATLGDVATHFLKATQVAFNKSTGFRTAFVTFLKQEDAAEAFNLKEIEIDGHTLKLNEYDSASNFSTKNKREGFKRRNFKHEDKPAKKRKF